MAENSKIEWTDHTFNPWVGCTKVGPGCDHCYAEARMDTRLHRVNWGPGQPRQRTKTWGDPVKWNKQHAEFFAAHGRRQRVFCASLADVFDNEVDPAWRDELMGLIASTPNLDWLLLTKRIGNVADMLAAPGMQKVLPANVRIGATIVNQPEYDRDIGKLLRLGCPTFLSIEPMLGPIDLRLGGASMPDYAPHRPLLGRIDWVICGGESGPGARPMHPDWARSLRDQCAAAGVPFMFKQWGEWLPVELPSSEECYAEDGSDRAFEGRIRVQRVPGHQDMAHVGTKAAGRRLDGVEHNGFPEPAGAFT